MSVVRNKTLEDIIRQIAKEQDLRIPQVEHIIDSQFRFINDQIESGEFKTVNAIYLGKFTSNGIYQAKQAGKFKNGKFIKHKKTDNQDKGNNSGLLASMDIQEQSDSTGSNEENKDM